MVDSWSVTTTVDKYRPTSIVIIKQFNHDSLHPVLRSCKVVEARESHWAEIGHDWIRANGRGNSPDASSCRGKNSNGGCRITTSCQLFDRDAFAP